MWISIKDRLPDALTEVLCCDVWKDGRACWVGYMHGEFWIDDGMEAKSPDYWMPVPDLPD